MKKNIKCVIALFSSVSILLSGCSLSKEDVKEATEYLNDDATDEASASDEAAEMISKVIVINDLFEPVLESEDLSESADEASTEASTEEKKEEASDPVDIVFFGDSQLANGRDEGTDIPHLIGERVPNSRIYNMAISGTTASIEASTTDVSPEKLTSTSFLGMAYCFAGKSDRNATLEGSYGRVLDTMNSIYPENVDYYVLSYGTNDFFNNVPLDVSTYNSIGEQSHALYNSMLMGIDVLKDISPDAHFIIMTPFYGIYVGDDGAYIGDSYIVSNGIGTLADYADKVNNVGEEKKIAVFDGMFKSRFDLYLDTASAYLSDNLHLSLTGRQIVARLLAHEFNYREKNEPFAYLDADYINIAEFDPEEDFRYSESRMKEYYPESWEKYITGMYPLAQPSEEAAAEYKGN